MGFAQWSFGYANGWSLADSLPAACSDAGQVTDVVMFTTQAADLSLGVSTERLSPYTASPHAIFAFTVADGWVRRSLYDAWDGPNPLIVAEGQPLWIELDAAETATELIYFAVLISPLVPPVGSAIGAGLRSSGARIAAPRIPRGFTG